MSFFSKKKIGSKKNLRDRLLIQNSFFFLLTEETNCLYYDHLCMKRAKFEIYRIDP